MNNFDVWYASKTNGNYSFFSKQKNYFDLEDDSIVTIAVRLQSKVEKYVAILANGKIQNILTFELANYLYEDQSNLRGVEITEITTCQKCGIFYIDEVFHYSHKLQPTTIDNVLDKVCHPTENKGDKQHIPCLAKQLYSKVSELKSKSELKMNEFYDDSGEKVKLYVPDEDYYIKLAKEIKDEL